MKKILILYGSYGSGHLSAAKNIKEYIDSNCSEIAETLLVDCIEYINKTLNKVSTTAFKEMATNAHWAWRQIYNSGESGAFFKISATTNKWMSHKLNKLLQEYNPDIIISTHYFSSQMCALLKKSGEINCKLATIITDYAPHGQWTTQHEHVDYFFVAHEGMKEQLSKYTVSPKKVFPLGIPLSSRFLVDYNKETIFNEFNLDSNKSTTLFFAGSKNGFSKNKNCNILRTLLEDFPDMQVIAVAGKSERTKEQFENIVSEKKANRKVKILEYTNQVPELMSISDVVITKPGGLTTTESMASNLPIIAINPIPGQEEENAEFLEKNGIGIWIKKNDNVKEKIKAVLNSPEKIESMKINAGLYAKRNSSHDICKVLLELPSTF
ncbi:MAG: glycosyltransferase [Oscillospiraceae bacterium]|nr:glycosyltransferase [Oscillospiraceae bacterium]